MDKPMLHFFLNLQLLFIYFKMSGTVQLSWAVLFLPLVGFLICAVLFSYYKAAQHLYRERALKEALSKLPIKPTGNNTPSELN